MQRFWYPSRPKHSVSSERALPTFSRDELTAVNYYYHLIIKALKKIEMYRLQ